MLLRAQPRTSTSATGWEYISSLCFIDSLNDLGGQGRELVSVSPSNDPKVAWAQSSSAPSRSRQRVAPVREVNSCVRSPWSRCSRTLYMTYVFQKTGPADIYLPSKRSIRPPSRSATRSPRRPNLKSSMILSRLGSRHALRVLFLLVQSAELPSHHLRVPDLEAGLGAPGGAAPRLAV